MSQVVVGKWGKSLAIRVPLDVARAARLSDGETVEIEEVKGDIHIRRPFADEAARQDAIAAMQEITIAAKGKSLGGLSVRDLRDEGRPR